MLDVFLSYGRADEEIVSGVYDALYNIGYRPWMDKRKLIPGQNWETEIEKSVRNADIFIAFFSSNSVNKRGVFQKELKLALDQFKLMLPDDIFLIPVKIGNCKVPDEFSRYQWIDFEGKKSYPALINALSLAVSQRGLLNEKNDLIFEYVSGTQEYSSLSVKYEVPQLIGPQRERLIEQVNSILMGKISGQIFNWKRFYKPNEEEFAGSFKSELNFSAEVISLSESFLSVKYYFYTYGSGAAHGNHSVVTENIYISDGIVFDLTEFECKEDAFILKATEKIDSKYDLSASLVRGVDEVHDSIKHSLRDRFTIHNEFVRLYFDPYEIFAYALGIIEIDFTFDELKPFCSGELFDKLLKEKSEIIQFTD